MANIDQKPSKYMYNLLHVLPSFSDEAKGCVNIIVEVSAGSINKYELINESGQLKLDRVGYSSLAYPFTYGAIPQTLDLDGDALDVLLVNVTEPLIAGCVAEMRVIGGVKFTDEGEIDDKIIGVLVNDKRVDHITSLDQLGEHFKTETKYYLENYKALKRPGTPNTGAVGKFLSTEQALEVVRESMERYEKDYKPKLAA